MSDLWFGTSGPRDADIVIVGEAWGVEEDRQKRPFVGESGRELDKMLAEAGIRRNDCFSTNILAKRPPDNELYHYFTPTKEARSVRQILTNGLYPNPELLAGLNRLYEQVRVIRPKVIIGCGNYPLWAFSSSVDIANSNSPSGWKVPGGITKWRGSQLVSDIGVPGFRFLPIYHPAGIMRNWATRPITVHDLRTRVPCAISNSWTKPVRHYILSKDIFEVFRYLNRFRNALDSGPVWAAADLETKGPTIACIGFTRDGLSAICIPFLRKEGASYASYWPFDQERAIIKTLRHILNHPNLRLIGQNFLYDTQYMSRWWRVLPRVAFDTLVAQHVMFPGTPKALYYLASLYNLTYYRFWKEDSKDWEEGVGDLDLHLTYNCDDCFETWNVWQAQKDALVKMNLTEQFSFKMREWQLAFEMMDKGVRIDAAVRGTLTMQVSDEATKRQAFLRRVVPSWCLPEVKKNAKPWYNSSKQQMSFFYDNLGIKSIHHRKTGNPTVDDTALKEISLRYPELTQITRAILELRSLGVFQNNFLSASIDPDGRMRCSFNPAGTDTMRWSSSQNAFGRGTNLQNIPKGDEEL